MLELGPRHGDVGGLNPRRLELSPCLGDVGFRRAAAGEAILGELQRIGEVRNRIVQQLLLGIRAAQLDIVDRQFGVQAEARRREVGRRRLRLLARGGDGAADATPEIDLIGEVQRQLELAGGRRMGIDEIGLMAGIAQRCHAGRDRDGGKFRGLLKADQRARLAETGFRLLQILVRGSDLLFQRIELAVAEHLPPRAARQRILRPRLPPQARRRVARR